MKKKISLLLVLILILTVALSSATVAFAANASLSVSGGGSYTKGSTVTINVTYSASSVCGGTSSITYDSSVLQYVSCSGGVAPSSASGVFSVQFVDPNDRSSMSYSLTFKAIGTGSTSVSVTTTDLIDYDGNALNFPSSSTSVSVTNPAPTVSSNANLSSLYVSAGSLSPSFSAGRTSYTVYVDEDETVCLISADAQDSGASIDVTGSKNLIMGANVRKVIVTAPSGNTKTYTITIYRGEASSEGEEPKEEEEEVITTTIGDVTYIIEENIKSEDVPEEFLLVVGKFEGKDIPLVKDADLKYTLALLKNQETGDYKWFFYNEGTGSFSESTTLSPEDVMKFVKLSANENKDGDEEGLFGDNEILLLMIFGGTLALLAVVVIILQYKIVKGKKKKKKAKKDKNEKQSESVEQIEPVDQKEELE